MQKANKMGFYEKNHLGMRVKKNISSLGARQYVLGWPLWYHAPERFFFSKSSPSFIDSSLLLYWISLCLSDCSICAILWLNIVAFFLCFCFNFFQLLICPGDLLCFGTTSHAAFFNFNVKTFAYRLGHAFFCLKVQVEKICPKRNLRIGELQIPLMIIDSIFKILFCFNFLHVTSEIFHVWFEFIQSNRFRENITKENF